MFLPWQSYRFNDFGGLGEDLCKKWKGVRRLRSPDRVQQSDPTNALGASDKRNFFIRILKAINVLYKADTRFSRNQNEGLLRGEKKRKEKKRKEKKRTQKTRNRFSTSSKRPGPMI